ncbi:MAG TPA: GTP-binding protein [Planctomycetaceae bacterium]|nr:GTP-binding protein [Planctomycetaceae bacterium]
MLKPRYVMIGGFLGAGKTTAILQLAKRLRDQGQRVGLITNDQSSGLVDTALLQSAGFNTEEITGGCFCCRFNTLVEAADKLTAANAPDVFITEPVGSCTDLQATVAFPLRRMYGDNYTIAPLSVVVDPLRAARVLGLETGKTFSPKVLYIYEKQLEEAELIVINKCDLVTEASQAALQRALEERFPQAKVLRVSARTGAGLDPWLECICDQETSANEPMQVDYDLYAEGEALLGWLNLSATLSGSEFDGNSLVQQLGDALRAQLGEHQLEIAHLKMTLSPDSGNDLAVGNAVRSQSAFELSHHLAEPLSDGELIVNLRAEGAPEVLQPLVKNALSSIATGMGVQFAITHEEAFRPGRPVPTHRLV